jgi:non-canonical (house-cleaning) NTP pyrophosphatase
LTIGQFFDCIKGYENRFEKSRRQTDFLNHILGSYISVAVNNPKGYPKHPFLEKGHSGAMRRMTDEEMALMAKRNAAQWKELENGKRNHG